MHYPRYNPQSPLTPLSEAELALLERVLDALPADGAMSLDGADGFLAALQVGPPVLLDSLPTADWLPWVWGGDGVGVADAAPFASKRQRKDIVVLLLRHLRHLGEQFETSPRHWEPVFSIAEQGGREWTDARDWCAGFLQAVDLAPERWPVDWADPALAPLLQLGGGLDGVATPALDPDDLEAVDTLSRAVPDAVLRLRGLSRGAAPAT